MFDCILPVKDFSAIEGLDEEVAGRKEPRKRVEIAGEGLGENVEADLIALGREVFDSWVISILCVDITACLDSLSPLRTLFRRRFLLPSRIPPKMMREPSWSVSTDGYHRSLCMLWPPEYSQDSSEHGVIIRIAVPPLRLS